jgi:hypothetical protein
MHDASAIREALRTIVGKREQLIGGIQEHYGLVQEEAEKEVDDFVRGLSYRRRKAAGHH